MSRFLNLVILVSLLTACGGAPVAIRYYVIDPVEVATLGQLGDRSVQILDIRLPQYLERFQIGKRQSSNQLTFSNNHQWAENLRKNLYRTMTRNLSSALGTADVGSSISRTLSPPDYLVRVSLEAFEQDANGYAVIAARFQVSNAEGEVVATEMFEQSTDRSSVSYDDMVADLQVLFGALCQEISTVVIRVDEADAG